MQILSGIFGEHPHLSSFAFFCNQICSSYQHQCKQKHSIASNYYKRIYDPKSCCWHIPGLISKLWWPPWSALAFCLLYVTEEEGHRLGKRDGKPTTTLLTLWGRRQQGGGPRKRTCYVLPSLVIQFCPVQGHQISNILSILRVVNFHCQV